MLADQKVPDEFLERFWFQKASGTSFGLRSCRQKKCQAVSCINTMPEICQTPFGSFEMALGDCMSCGQDLSQRPRLPKWLKKPVVNYPRVHAVKQSLRDHRLHTICEEGKCPNLGECFERGTATIMVMGDICTRACRFCAVKTGRPRPLDPEEPLNTAKQIHLLGLKMVVLTSVDRDDLDDGGAAHIAECIRETKRLNPETKIEFLTPDFDANSDCIQTVCDAVPDVYSHNIETVERLTPKVRSRAQYRRSLDVLRYAFHFLKIVKPDGVTKSGIMLGLGETKDEVIQTLKDLREANVECVTMGQYLQPTPKHYPVVEFIEPQRFEEYDDICRELGFRYSFCGPFVRSSYMAEQVFENEPMKPKIYVPQVL